MVGRRGFGGGIRRAGIGRAEEKHIFRLSWLETRGHKGAIAELGVGGRWDRRVCLTSCLIRSSPEVKGTVRFPFELAWGSE